jgi:ketosteroid isomerase-like protein
MTPEEIFQRYTWAGLTRDADAQAAMYAPDGVFEAPLARPDGGYPRRLEGREAIRDAFAALHRRSAAADVTVLRERSGYVLHVTEDPDVFIAEIDTAVEVGGEVRSMSLVQIFRMKDGEIALLRDYFAG